MSFTVNLLRRGGTGLADSVLFFAEPMTDAELRQRIKEQLRLPADVAEHLRLVHRGQVVRQGDTVEPTPDEVMTAILPRSCEFSQATTMQSPPDGGSPGSPQHEGNRRLKRRRRTHDSAGEPCSCRAARINTTDPVTVARPATFHIVPPAVQNDFAWRVLRVVEAIPRGKVAAYGQVARYAGAPRNARQVGKLLATVLCGGGVPWQRVINAAGKISLPAESGGNRQHRLLVAEGVRFKESTETVVPEAFWSPCDSAIQSLFRVGVSHI